MEMAKILAVLNQQQEKLQSIFQEQEKNSEELNSLYNTSDLDIVQIEGHRAYGIKLVQDAVNQERIIANTKSILEKKQIEVREAHQKVEVMRKLKENQEKEYYQEFLHAETKEIDDITTSRFNR